ncbi:MAG TPA: transcription-repair coupling factor [Candidatus Xenobia bacterium]|nr:transcription-repair coupling factor [Candidatus Xenobia bacterium]
MILPFVEQAVRPLEESAALQAALRALEKPAPSEVTLAGLTDTAKLLATALAARALGRPLFFITASNRRAEELIAPLRFFYSVLTGRPESAVALLPARDVSPYRRLSSHPEIAAERAQALWRLGTGEADLAVVALPAALGRLAPRELYAGLGRLVHPGETLERDELVSHLESVGYERREPVESPGEFSVRGGIVDIFPPEGRPLRLEFFGDTLEELREFDPATQRSTAPLVSATLVPLIEIPATPGRLRQLWALREGQEPEGQVNVFPGWEFLLPLIESLGSSLLELAPRAVVALDEPRALRDEALKFWSRLEEDYVARRLEPGPAPAPGELYLRWQAFEAAAASRPRLNLEELALEITGADHFALASQPTARFRGAVRAFADEVRGRVRQGGPVVISSATTGEMERMAEILSEYEIPYRFGMPTSQRAGLVEEKGALGDAQAVVLVRGALPEGVSFPELPLTLFGNFDLFEAAPAAAPAAAKTKAAAFAADIATLEEGDLVVHVDHGIGEFAGLHQLTHAGVTEEFFRINYLGGDRLYVPLARLDLVQKYRGLGGARPQLDRLGGVTWQRRRQRAARAVRAMAGELLQLYAARAAVAGHAFGPDTPWQREFEESFEWEATADQRAATEEVKRDMERGQPMDRLLVGDVGFGKTEVALRAAFKAVCGAKQVAVLAPTTVLAFQHYENFRRRLAPFPLRVEMLSRFRTRAEQKQILADLEAGKVDIIVGTHSLLGPQVRFHDLGLLVVDEEQRFGVRHKERLKQLRTNVDVLTLTATPIPRTLSMALTGLRDLSLIQTAPPDRLAIQTVVATESDDLVRSALEQELARDGQVFYVHDRIETIYGVAEKLHRLAPRARIAVAHGKMKERELERIMLGFMQHHYDVLVTTKIIENGLDIPLCNTIVVDRADRFGLAELYQLRGRVGRSNRRAYAYLLVPRETRLTETARKRLAALKEFSELGSGFRLAALDLELRGAGNLLGAEQHGHVNAVGFDLYTQMLERALTELRSGTAAPLEAHVTLKLGVDIRIPADYIEDERQRLRMYRRIADAGDALAAQRALLAELEDRYGPPPRPVLNLLHYAAVKAVAERLLIESIEHRQGDVLIRFHPETRVAPERLVGFVRRTQGARLEPSGLLRFPVERTGQWLEALRRQVLALEG